MADLTRNAVDVLPDGRLAEQLAGDRPLRVKLGIDPTTADIHLGHTVVLEKLGEFQRAGHTVVVQAGGFWARRAFAAAGGGGHVRRPAGDAAGCVGRRRGPARRP